MSAEPKAPVDSYGVPVVESQSGRKVALFGSGETLTAYGVDNMAVVRAPRAIIDASLGLGAPMRKNPLALVGDSAVLDEDHVAWAKDRLDAPLAEHPFAHLEPEVTQLNISNTLGCNMGCTYCYNGLPDKALDDVTPTAVRMSPEVGRATIDALIDGAPQAEQLGLVFIGGESLLQRDLLKDTVAYAHQRAAHSGKSVGVTVYTNGVLLDDDVTDWSNATGVSLCVSIDGPPEIHDRHRIFHTGKPTSPVIFQNIRRFMSRTQQRLRRVRAVATDPTLLRPMHEYLLDLGFNDIWVQPVYDAEGMPEDAAAQREVIDWYGGLLEAGFVLEVHPFGRLIRQIAARGSSVTSWHPCGAGATTLGVGPEGEVTPCHHFHGEADYEIGNVTAGLPAFDERRAYFSRVNERTACQSCWAQHLCGGECYHRANTVGAGYDGTVDAWCDSKRSFYAAIVELYARLQQRRPGVIQNLIDRVYTTPSMNAHAYEVQDFVPYLRRS